MAQRQTTTKPAALEAATSALLADLETVATPGVAPIPASSHSTTYEQLSAPFDVTFTDVRGGVELTYVTGEQVASRLCEVLGVAGWSFRVLEHGINVEADEVWVLGEMTAEVDGRTTLRQQFGSQKVKRSRSSGQPLDIGFDLKGAATDALKKCASLLGVGLYLSRKESGANGHGPAANGASASPASASPASVTRVAAFGGAARMASGDAFSCEECSAELKETRFKDGTVWGPAQLAGYGRRKHGKVLCMEHYRAANEARKGQLLSA